MICLHTAIQLLMKKCARVRAQIQWIETTHTRAHARTTYTIFDAQWLIKMLFPNSIENHFFNYNQNFFVQFNLKSFFFARSLLLSLRLFTPFASLRRRFGIVIHRDFGVSLSQFNLLSICLCVALMLVCLALSHLFACPRVFFLFVACPSIFFLLRYVLCCCACLCNHSQGL